MGTLLGTVVSAVSNGGLSSLGDTVSRSGIGEQTRISSGVEGTVALGRQQGNDLDTETLFLPHMNLGLTSNILTGKEALYKYGSLAKANWRVGGSRVGTCEKWSTLRRPSENITHSARQSSCLALTTPTS